MSLRTHILSLPSLPPQNPLTAAQALAKQGVAVPFALPLPSRDGRWKVAFEPPTEITVVGSWGNGIAVKKKNGSRFGIDLSVEMPGVRHLPICSPFRSIFCVTGSFPRERLPRWAVLPQEVILPRCFSSIHFNKFRR